MIVMELMFLATLSKDLKSSIWEEKPNKAIQACDNAVAWVHSACINLNLPKNYAVPTLCLTSEINMTVCTVLYV